MSQWGTKDLANNAPEWKFPFGAANTRGVDVYQNNTPAAFRHANGMVIGLYGVDANEATLKGKGVSPGWVMVRTGEGPVTAATISGGLLFANGETIKISNGSSNGTLTVVTNAAGNAASLTITDGGIFKANTNVVVGFNRQKSIDPTATSKITIVGTATGYSNTDVVTVSNAISNAILAVSTNSTGGSLGFTVVNRGLFSNTITKSQVVVTIANSTGGASGGSGATFTAANVQPSSGGTVVINTLGGRAGRQQYETLAYAYITTSNTGDDGIFPDS
jgi:hypothetical protein